MLAMAMRGEGGGGQVGKLPARAAMAMLGKKLARAAGAMRGELPCT